jgi:hypothetical protein
MSETRRLIRAIRDQQTAWESRFAQLDDKTARLQAQTVEAIATSRDLLIRTADFHRIEISGKCGHATRRGDKHFPHQTTKRAARTL